MEEIFKNFEAKKAEVLKQSEAKETELSLERQKEILKEVVDERISIVQSIPTGQQQAINQTAQKIKDAPKERQVELLIQMAMDKGIIESVVIAKNLDNPYLLDEFHDALIDHFYNELVKRGKLKQI